MKEEEQEQEQEEEKNCGIIMYGMVLILTYYQYRQRSIKKEDQRKS